MVQAVSSEIAKQNRKMEKARITGCTEWRTDFIGTRVKQVEDSPQAYLSDMQSHGFIRPHFHQVNQFQIFVSGNGSLGRKAVPLIALHYVDHHTAYGPINAGPFGLSFFTMRQRADPGGFYLHMPEYKDMLKPTKKRYLLTDSIALSTAVVLENRREIALESVLGETDGGDGLGAFILRMGAGMKTMGPDPGSTGGQYYLVVNGGLEFDGARYPTWSTVYASPADTPLEVCAGHLGVEALVLNFPRRDS